MLFWFQSASENAPHPSGYVTLMVGLPSCCTSVLFRSGFTPPHDASLHPVASSPPLYITNGVITVEGCTTGCTAPWSPQHGHAGIPLGMIPCPTASFTLTG